MAAPVPHKSFSLGSNPSTPTNLKLLKIPSDEILDYIRNRYYTSDGKIFSCAVNREVCYYNKTNKRYQILIKKRSFKRTHLVWFLSYGEWPSQEIDHVDRDRTNDEILNLRYLSRENQCSNVDYRGVRKDKNDRGIYRVRRGWQVQLWKRGKRYIVGYYQDKDEARKAFREKYLELWGVPYE